MGKKVIRINTNAGLLFFEVTFDLLVCLQRCNTRENMLLNVR